MKLAFVILNYETLQETTQCIKSIKKYVGLSPDEYNITIVDNGSMDGSGKRIQELHKDDKNIDFIFLDRNLGFAKGNNVGINYVNNKYAPDFLIVLNSDTELFQDNLYKKILNEYNHSQFGLLGPMILSEDGRCDNSPWKPMSQKRAEKILADLIKERKRILNGTIIFSMIISTIRRKLGFYSRTDKRHIHKDFWKYNTNVELQGAFLIFSKNLFKYIEGFDPRTFLYYEEQLLYLSIVRCGMPIVYDPQICIYHKVGSSRKNKGISKEKMLFQNKCNIESLEYVLEEIKNSVGSRDNRNRDK